jgi:hemerythrin-like domain-containing protein
VVAAAAVVAVEVAPVALVVAAVPAAFSLPAYSIGGPMSESIAHWHAEHKHFSRLLDLLEQQVVAFHGDDGPNHALMLDIVSYLRYFPDRYHHPREDVAFARLVKRDPAMKQLIERLRQEHRVIAAAGSELLKYLEQVVDDVVVERAKVEAAAATYLVYYRRHLALEDRDIMPQAEQLLTPQDWEAVMAAHPAGPDPLFGEDAEPRYRELRRQIALAAPEL